MKKITKLKQASRYTKERYWAKDWFLMKELIISDLLVLIENSQPKVEKVLLRNTGLSAL